MVQYAIGMYHSMMVVIVDFLDVNTQLFLESLRTRQCKIRAKFRKIVPFLVFDCYGHVPRTEEVITFRRLSNTSPVREKKQVDEGTGNTLNSIVE